jgi:glycosyltransferase involved in cell wall biosynthesis
VKNPDKSYCRLGDDSPPEGVRVEYTSSIINLYWFVTIAHAVLRRIFGMFGIRLKVNYFYDFLCIPDHFWGWIPLTVMRGKKLISERNIQLIYVSCTPHSSAISGILLKKLTGRPLIIDYRDPYYIGSYKYRGLKELIGRRIQNYFLRKADFVIVNNEGTARVFIEEYPVVKNKIFTVHNGFDIDFMPDHKLEKYKKFTITYTGNFYSKMIPPKLVFDAISILDQEGKITADNFQFLFYGEAPYKILEIARKCGAVKYVSVNSMAPYADALQVLSRSHLQLLRIVKPMISTKLFEGIPLNIPFLATIPPGEVEEIIKAYSPSSLIVTTNSARDVANAISRAISMYEKLEVEDNHVEEYLESFSRENLTLKLMGIIEENVLIDESLAQ